MPAKFFFTNVGNFYQVLYNSYTVPQYQYNIILYIVYSKWGLCRASKVNITQ